MDLDAYLNLALIVSACILVVAVAYRMARGRGSPAKVEGEPAGGHELAPQGTRTIPLVIPERPVRAAPKTGPGVQMFREAVTENPEEVRRSARKMVDYALVRGGATHIRPEVLDRIALQFGLLEVVLKGASRDEEGRPCDIPQEEMSEILRESFRLAASQARR